MSYVISTFSELVSKYSSWEELRSYLLSKEGGSLRLIEPVDGDLVIVRYTKGVSDFTKEHVPHFRSVVWHKLKNRPVSVAPVKAEGSVPPEGAVVHVSDFVDGTMLHAWKDADGKLGIASRTSLGAKGSFYSSRSFAELLEETLEVSGGTNAFLDSMLSPNKFISLVLQHKEHKIVSQVPSNRVFVTHYGSVDPAGSGQVSFEGAPSWPQGILAYAPEVYEMEVVMKNAKALFAEHDKKVHTSQGIVFQSTLTAQRWRMRNPSYMTARGLRGSEAKPAERFLRLRASGNTKKYLSYFREESADMWKLEELFRKQTDDLYEAYNDMNKRKVKGMRDLPYCFRPHVYALHGKYLSTLPNPVPVIKQTVIEYVNALPQEEQLKILQGDTPVRIHPSALAPIDSVQPQVSLADHV
jgi:hypothetical protein